MWRVLVLSDNLVIDSLPLKKPIILFISLVLKVGGGNVDSNNIEYYYILQQRRTRTCSCA